MDVLREYSPSAELLSFALECAAGRKTCSYPLLSGAELEAAIRRGILMKPARHRMDETGVTETHRGMFAIGG